MWVAALFLAAAVWNGPSQFDIATTEALREGVRPVGIMRGHVTIRRNGRELPHGDPIPDDYLSLEDRSPLGEILFALEPLGGRDVQVHVLDLEREEDRRLLDVNFESHRGYRTWRLLGAGEHQSSAIRQVPGTLELASSEGHVAWFDVNRVSAATAPSGAAWADWVYSRTFLRPASELFDTVENEPALLDMVSIHDRRNDFAHAWANGDEAGTERAIYALLALGAPSRDLRWWGMAAWAVEHDRLELAAAVHARWVPTGEFVVGNDCVRRRSANPQEGELEYAEVLRRQGDFRGWLSIALRGARREPPVSSGLFFVNQLNEALDGQPFATGPEPFVLDRFLRGLVIGYDGVEDPGALSVERVASLIRETGRARQLDASIARFAADPALDDYNRLRAAKVLFLTRVKATGAPGGAGLADARAVAQEENRVARGMLLLSLSEDARRWLKRR